LFLNFALFIFSFFFVDEEEEKKKMKRRRKKLKENGGGKKTTISTISFISEGRYRAHINTYYRV